VDPASLRAEASASRYGRVAGMYELATYLGSGGQIDRNRKYHLGFLSRPSTVLYAGPGRATDVALAAAVGHAPTMVELSPTMMKRATALFRGQGVLDRIERIQGSILEHDRPDHYDAVVGSYFLDVFSPEVSKRIYTHLVRQLKPGGLLALAGYAPAHGSALHRLLQDVNHLYTNVLCRLVVNNARHGIYDYAEHYDELNLVPLVEKDFPFFGSFGPRFHRAWVARKAP
jgi:SAM-dependent methyltransferase